MLSGPEPQAAGLCGKSEAGSHPASAGESIPHSTSKCKLSRSPPQARCMILAPLVCARKKQHTGLFHDHSQTLLHSLSDLDAQNEAMLPYHRDHWQHSATSFSHEVSHDCSTGTEYQRGDQTARQALHVRTLLNKSLYGTGARREQKRLVHSLL